MDHVVTNQPDSTPSVPLDFGQIWDRMLRLVEEHEYKPTPGIVLGTAKWDRIMAIASERDRSLLESMRECGQIIVSPHLPDPEVAYRFAPEVQPETQQPFPLLGAGYPWPEYDR